MPTNNIFSYSSNPLPVKPNSRKKYKDDDINLTIMSDPRVVRGMVSASLKKPLTNEKIREKTSKLPKNERTRMESREEGMSATSVSASSSSGTGSYSYHVRSLVQDDIDVTKYLIEDVDSTTVSMKVHETQTDQFHSRPVTPEYIPRKTGIDRSTQVEEMSELFIFDEEVDPMLQVIVAKTLEQAVFELEREAELLALETEIESYHHQRLIEQQWLKKREEETIADSCIKDLALKGMKEKQSGENIVRVKVAARQSMLQILPNMIEEIGRELYTQNIWKKPSQEYVTQEFLPQMVEEMTRRVAIYEQAKELLDEILWEAAQREIILPTPPPTPPPPVLPNDNQSPRPRKILLTIHLPLSDQESTIGPFEIEEGETIASLQEKIQDYVGEAEIEAAMFPLQRYLASALGYLSPREMDMDLPLERVRLPDRIDL